MAPDQGPTGSSTAHSTTAAYAVMILYDDKPEEQYFEPIVPTSWMLESRRYDRINAGRKYLSEVAKAKRHHGQRNLLRKLARKKIRR